MASQNPEVDLIVLAKAPLPGQVKTRLMPPCTPEQAAAIAEAALVDTLAACVASRARKVLLVLDGEPGRWFPSGVDIVPQVDGPLDRRLAAAWSHTRGPAVQIGMDTPQVTARLLDEVMDRLEQADSLLGLATDGGWWVAGMRSPQPKVFLGVPTSSFNTGQTQLDRFRAFGLAPVQVETLTDVDTWNEALAVADQAPATRFAAAVRSLNGTHPSR